MRYRRLSGCVVAALSIGACSDSTDAPADDEQVATLFPGECRGVDCSDVEPAALELPAATRCSLEEGPRFDIEWVHDLEEIDCFVGRCRLGGVTSAVGEAGDVWLNASLYPAAVPPESAPPAVGSAWIHLDSEGKADVTKVLALTSLSPQRPSFAAETLFTNVRGALVAFGRSPGLGATYSDLSRYDAEGKLVERRFLSDGFFQFRGAFIG